MKKAFITVAICGSINFHCFIPLEVLIEVEYYRKIIARLIRIETETKLLIENYIQAK